MARTSKPIEDLISRGGQDITARRVFKIADHKVRITIKSDAYKFQSFARSEVWNPTELKWNQVQAQFDNLELEYNGINLAHGWHIFPLAAFEVDPEPAEDGDEQE